MLLLTETLCFNDLKNLTDTQTSVCLTFMRVNAPECSVSSLDDCCCLPDFKLKIPETNSQFQATRVQRRHDRTPSRDIKG